MFVNTAPKAVRELAAWGLPWSRVTRGNREVIINGQKVTDPKALTELTQQQRRLWRITINRDGQQISTILGG